MSRRLPELCDLPDARDGLTRKERVVLWVLHRTQAERNGRSVRAAQLYGRVLEHVDMSIPELMQMVERLSGRPTRLLVRSQQERERDDPSPTSTPSLSRAPGPKRTRSSPT
jgi:hypothetical protein